MGASFCIRRDDTDGKDIKTFLDTVSGDHIQAIALVDEDGNQFAIFPISDGGGSITIDSLAEHQEDAPHETDHYGIFVLGVRDEDGNYAPLHLNEDGSLSVGIGGGGAVTVIQPVHDLLNCNANIQVGDVDVGNANPVPVSDAAGSLTVDQPTHDNLNANANIQVGDADVAAGNPVPVDIVDHVATAFDHGSNSGIGVAATQLIVASVPATLGVEVKAANSNTANVYIGNSDVTAATVDATDGFELGAGESILIRIDDVNKIYAISTLAAQRVFWMVV